MKKLYQYPILHRFLAELYTRCDIYIVDDMFKYIKDDFVSGYCRCKDSGCSTVYLRCDRLPVLEDGEDSHIETYDCDKGLLVLHFFTNGDIEIEALEYDYPFRAEVREIYNQENGYALESDLEIEQQEKRLSDAKIIVDDYFDTKETELNTIVVD